VSGDGTYHPSAGYTPSSAGTYYWYAGYSGDGGNQPSDSGCGTGMTSTAVSATNPRQLRLSVKPGRVQAGIRACFAFRTTSNGHHVGGVTVHLAGHTARTSQAGTATICAVLHRGTHHPSATKRSYRTAHATITVTRAPPRFTG
jgi:hypothetical protein